jgi:hypothetical protein
VDPPDPPAFCLVGPPVFRSMCCIINWIQLIGPTGPTEPTEKR